MVRRGLKAGADDQSSCDSQYAVKLFIVGDPIYQLVNPSE
jgi:hypothetical protein